jgi:hypothetical protein
MKVSTHQDADGYWITTFPRQPGTTWAREVYDWCRQSYGIDWHWEDQVKVPRWFNNICYGNIKFQNEKDAILFVLRWT